MANTVYMSKTGLIGGEATKLDSIDGAGLVDGDAAFVNVSNVQYIYRLDADSAAAESSPNIIAPDTNPGDKRWILQGLNGASLNMPGLTASLPVFTDGSKNLASKSVADTLTALGVGAWTDYSATSTFDGWASYVTKYLKYKIIDKIVFVNFCIIGEAEGIMVSFTVPYDAVHPACARAHCAQDAVISAGAYSLLPESSDIVYIYPDANVAAWDPSKTARIAKGQFFYEMT